MGQLIFSNRKNSRKKIFWFKIRACVCAGLIIFTIFALHPLLFEGLNNLMMFFGVIMAFVIILMDGIDYSVEIYDDGFTLPHSTWDCVVRRPKTKIPWSDLKDYFVSEFTFAPTAWIWVEFHDGKRIHFDFTAIGRKGFRHLLFHFSRNVKTNVPAGMVKIAPGSKKPVRLKRLRDVLRW